MQDCFYFRTFARKSASPPGRLRCGFSDSQIFENLQISLVDRGGIDGAKIDLCGGDGLVAQTAADNGQGGA